MDFKVPVGKWMERAVDFCLTHFAGAFDTVSYVIARLLQAIEAILLLPVPSVMIALISLVAAWRVGWRFALFTLVFLRLIVGMGLWPQTMSTLALIIGATSTSLAVGVPLGILAAKNNLAEAIIRPILDLMQTLPPFVYLIPAAMFFGLGKVPGTIATIIFSMPPAVRLTNLGIRGVDRELVEAGISFGCTPRQLLLKVQLPLALPSIMAGLNQTIMLALSMVVIASMIGAGGLGNEVLAGIQRLDIGRGFEGGFAVVILAIVLDRITQSFGSLKAPDTVLQHYLHALLGKARARIGRGGS
jgi:glycine betaine/proline transport system permease protein